MRTPSTRTLAALAYERGEEFDPSLWLSPALIDQLAAAERACRPLEAPSPYERRRRRERERREAYARVPGWFSAGDLAEPACSDGRLSTASSSSRKAGDQGAAAAGLVGEPRRLPHGRQVPRGRTRSSGSGGARWKAIASAIGVRAIET